MKIAIAALALLALMGCSYPGADFLKSREIVRKDYPAGECGDARYRFAHWENEFWEYANGVGFRNPLAGIDGYYYRVRAAQAGVAVHCK